MSSSKIELKGVTMEIYEEDESYYVLSKYDIEMLTHNKKRVTCTMVDKERFRDERL